MRLLLCLLSLSLISAPASFAFSLIGPFDTWQTADIGYGVNENSEEIGGPMNIGEEYRWNVRVITYGFDPSFLNFFGRKGIEEVNKAISAFNALPSFSKVSSNLSEFSMNTRRINYRAESLRLWDLKSMAMSVLCEQLGLANPYNYTWTLRDKVAIQNGFTYQVIMRNMDPATAVYSRHVNGVLYSYVVLDPVPGFIAQFADAVELSVDPFAPAANAVAASPATQYSTFWSQRAGRFFVGLSRDDVGGLRYVYSAKNRNIEGLLPGTLGLVGGGAWSPVSGTNSLVDVAVRPGIDRIVLRELKFDAGGFGGFTARTNREKDVYITGNRQFQQSIGRPLPLPDIVFAAADLNRSIATRTDTQTWINNAVTNSPGGSGGNGAISGGPGVISPPVIITFNKIGPSIINQYSGNSFFLDEASGTPVFMWGSFDGSTNTPFIYPVDLNGNSYPIQELEQTIYGGLITLP